MRKMLKQINSDKQNSVLENRGTRLDAAHLHFGSEGMAA